MSTNETLGDVYTSLIEIHGNRLYKLCLKLTYSKADADDLFSETILKVFERPEKLKTDHPERILFRTAGYLFKDSQRKYARRMRLVPTVPLEQMEVRDGCDVGEMVVQEEVHQRLNELIQALPEMFKLPLVLYYTLEMKVSDVAKTLDLPEGTVMSRLKRGRERLKKQLTEMGYHDE